MKIDTKIGKKAIARKTTSPRKMSGRVGPDKKPVVVLATGGTAGHMFPALSLADSLRERGFQPVFLVDKRGMSIAQSSSTYIFHHIPSKGGGGGVSGIIVACFYIFWGMIKALWIMRELKPVVVAGFGSYASLPALLAASLIRTKIMLHEQNAILGRANRLIGPAADIIATSFEKTEKIRKNITAPLVWTGNPVRKAILEEAKSPRPAFDPKKEFNLLVFGGSQGARIMGEVIPQALALLPVNMRAQINLVQQVLPPQKAIITRAYKKIGLKSFELAPFLTDIAHHLSTAHLVIARSGASTLAEITAMGRPAILVPYPYGTDDHQTANAARLSDAGGGWLIPEENFTPEAVAEKLIAFFTDPRLIDVSALCTKKLGMPHAGESLFRLVENLTREVEVENQQREKGHLS